MTVPYTFAASSGSIPLSYLDSNFATTITMGNTAVQLGDTITTFNNVTLASPTITAPTMSAVTISSGNATVTSLTATTGTFSGNVQMASANGGQLAGLRNKIINGNMGISQRGTTAATTNGAYGPADRWLNQANGNVFSTSQGSFVSGDTLYDTGGAQYFTQIAVTSTVSSANYNLVTQRIEDVRILAGQTVTVSFWAKAASGTPSIGLEIAQSFGTGGSPSTAVTGTGQAQALTTTWTKYSKTFTVPSINGKTLGTTANTSYTELNFWIDAGSPTYDTRSGSIGQSSKTVSIAQVQLEVGPVATPFEQIPIGLSLQLCQRYYQSGIFVNDVGVLNGTTYFAAIRLKVTMRASPSTVTFTNPNVYAGASTLSVTSTTPDNLSADTVGVAIVATTQPQGACRILGGTYTASAEL